MHNSYFNGIVLGYPQRFVESYTNSLPNKLNETQKRRALDAGKAAVANAIASGQLNKDDLRIRINRTAGVNSRKWNFIKHRVMTAVV